MKQKTFGVGLGNFVQEFYLHGPLEKVHIKKSIGGKVRWFWGYRHYRKATHSVYNQNGAELGYGGLMIFVGILYSCLRTLVTMSKGGEEEERVRRALFSVVISYIVSCWMVDFAYRPTFFLFVAAAGALHRILRANSPEARAIAEQEHVDPEPVQAWRRLKPAGSLVNSPSLMPIPLAPASEPPLIPKVLSPVEDDSVKTASIKWVRFGWIDLVMTFLLTEAVVAMWLYSIRKF